MFSLQAKSLLWLFLSYCAQAALFDSTVDDDSADSRGTSIQYAPADSWNFPSGCEAGGCSVQLDPSQINGGTWHESTFSAVSGEGYKNPNKVLNASLTFSGNAIYVYRVLARTQQPSSNTDMTFYIDGQFVGALQKPAPGSSGYDYNVLVYVNTSLSPGLHTFVLQNGHVNGSNSLAIFDKIVYSYDDGTTSTSSSDPLATSTVDFGPEQNSSSVNVAVIVGPAVAVPLAAIVLGLCICLWVRRRRRRSYIATPINPHLIPYMVAQVPGSTSLNSTDNTRAYNSTPSGSKLFLGMSRDRNPESFCKLQSHRRGRPQVPTTQLAALQLMPKYMWARRAVHHVLSTGEPKLSCQAYTDTYELR
ncbi:hypothetical protein D9758_006726 [Tetrapyrgos nigripes]|uniref:Uncharacterized protein n=1 Tax=Tetrapyrgos nigripes TaxID=182062 RepID=A0A8H5GIZ7_9AGAR|nr:hypothetical protein D9758_006726 [Tetrapyrgos nigripes]